MTSEVIMAKTKAMIDDLKTVCANYGLGNASSEYKIITEVFLYKFLNDKFLHEIRKVDDKLQNVENIEDKAAVVVPTGFLTAGTGIPKSIREYIIKERMLRGVISMPSNIFATTGTNVSILFLDRANKDGKVLLMDASKLGHKEKVDGKNQRTVLEPEEIQDIIGTFINGEEKDDFSVLVDYEQIEQKKLSFSAGQYFEVKIEYVELTPEEFDAKMNDYTVELQNLFAEGNKLQQEILEQLKKVRYE